MAVSESTSESPNAELEITLGLLTAIDRNHKLTQRRLAHDLGIALGLANTYLKRCVTKGLIKITTAPANRYVYYLTPQGFAEKSRLTAEFLTQSFKLFRIAQNAYAQLLEKCERADRRRIAIVGGPDLTHIIQLCIRDSTCEIVKILPAFSLDADLNAIDVIFLADLSDPQRTYDMLVEAYGSERVIAPHFLNISERTMLAIDEPVQ